ncbi:MAG: hypothetical protein JNL70_22110 [Saprospiraceae bacterium]|nr:hypothetical protein [Saprospiraceae bacterium]
MDPKVIAVSIPIISTIGLFTMIIFLRRYHNMERMAMIERGMNPADLKTEFRAMKRRERDPFRFLRIACALVGVGLGLFIGNVLRMIDFLDRGGIVAGLVCIFGGGGLLVGYFIQMSMQNKANFTRKPYEEDSDIL